jgi:hypothetical protein
LLLLLNVEGFCCFFWMLKIFTHIFGCWRFLLLLLDVKGCCFYSWMFKAIAFILGCSKFLLLVIHVESYCSYSWILKVLIFVLKCWRFLLPLLDVESFWFWMLKVCVNSSSFVYLHIFLKNYVRIDSILFRSWLYKFSLTYNDERFMKGDFLMIIMLHMSCFVFEHLWRFFLFLCYKVKLSLYFNPSTSKLCIQGKILSKIPKIVIQFT